jgi:predicted phage-related endonuclease
MLTHELTQGSPEWHAYRATHDNASDAPAMMGESSYKTRDQLIAEVATGIVPDVDAATQRLFDSGHRFEALARPRAEAIIGQDLYPCTGSAEGSRLSASFDGLTMSEDVAFEHKRLNRHLRAAFADMETVAPEYRERQSGRCLPLEYQIQMEQQCAVSGCEKVLFMATHWADDDTLLEQQQCWYFPNLELRARIVVGWEQFHGEVDAYVAPDPAAVVNVTAKLRETLPALVFEAKGEVTACNVDKFKVVVLEHINTVNMQLVSDQDFADGDADAKWLRDVSTAMKSAAQRVRNGMVSVNEVLTVLEQLDDLATKKAIAVEKLVKARKEEIRGEIVASGITALHKHITELNAAMPMNYMPLVPVDFYGVVKGRRTVDSLRSAVNDELARAKIAANEIANRIHANVKTLQSSGLVVHDAAALVLKAPDDLAAIIANRVSAEQQRQEVERERIRKEEADREAREKLAAEERAAQAAIAQAAKAETLHPAVAADLGGLVREQHAEAVAGLDAQQVIGTAQRATVVPIAAPAARTGPPTLRIGVIKERLGHMTVTAEDLRALGFEPAGRERAAPLYYEDDFPAICDAIAAQAMTSKSAFLESRAAVTT